MSTEPLDAIGRVRLFIELSNDCHNVGWGFVYNPQFQSEEWPHQAYALKKDDMLALIAAYDELLKASKSAPQPLCNCGCAEKDHQGPEGLGGAQCLRCPEDGERGWRHPYTPQTAVECACGVIWEDGVMGNGHNAHDCDTRGFDL